MVVETAAANIRIPFPQFALVWSSSLSHDNKHFLSVRGIVYHRVFESFERVYKRDGVHNSVSVFNL